MREYVLNGRSLACMRRTPAGVEAKLAFTPHHRTHGCLSDGIGRRADRPLALCAVEVDLDGHGRFQLYEGMTHEGGFKIEKIHSDDSK